MEPKQAASKTTEKTLNIYGYTEYRTYLKDFYEFRKEGSRGYSYRAFSKSAGFSSPNILKLVIEGERNIGPEAIDQFIKGLGLSGSMAEYFAAMVKMNQSKNDEEKEKWFNELKKLMPHSKKRELNAEAVKYLSHWIYPVIREMVLLDDFRDDPYWIARRINGNLNTNEIAAALRFLIKEGYIEKQEDGKYKTKDSLILSSDEVRSLAVRNYHRQMLEKAKEVLETLPMEEREFGAVTMNIPKESLDELKFKLKTFRKQLHAWAVQVADGKSVDSVVQVNLQMFPFTKRV